MDGKKKIGINEASIVGLKAELFRKQEEFKRERLQNAGSSISRPKPSTKKPSIWNKKNAGVQSRAEKDTQLTTEEEDALAKSQSMLAAKAKLYEKMTGGDIIPDESTNERFLVDFEKKVVDKIHTEKKRKETSTEMMEESDVHVVATAPTREEMMRKDSKEVTDDSDIPPPANDDEEWVDYVDTLGRSRRCMRKDLPNLINMDKNLNPDKFKEQEKKEKLGTEALPDLLSEDMYREMLRKKWEAEEVEAAKRGPGPVHYQNVKYDEVRELGVGYFDFSKDETQRQEQMESLQMLRDETVDQRAKREHLKAKRKAAMQARLAKVKQRKKLKGEIPGLGNEEDDKDDVGGVVKETKPEALEDRLADKSYEMLMGGSKKKQPVREWDIGKDPNLWEEAKQKARDERLSEFAPPSAYNDSTPQHGHKKSSHAQSHRETSSPNLSQASSSMPSMSNAEKALRGEEFSSFVPHVGFQSHQSSRTNRTTQGPSQGFSGLSNKSDIPSGSRTTSSSSTGDVNKRTQEEARTMVDEDSINQSLSFFRKQSQKN